MNNNTMPALWWIKSVIIFCVLIFGIVYTIPTFLGNPAQWQGASGEPRKWYMQVAENFLPESRINLGLDLKGGISLTLNVELDKAVQDALARGSITRTYVAEYENQLMQQAINTIRNRIDQFGVAEPNIFQAGNTRIVVELPGMTDTQRAKQLIGNTAQLDFRLVLNDVVQTDLPELITSARKALELPEKDYQVATIEKISQWLRDNKKIPKTATILLHRTMGIGPDAGKVVTSVPYLVESTPKVTGNMLEDAQAVQSTENYVPQYVVTLKFKPQGAKLFGDLTTEAYDAKHAPHQIAIILDGNVQTAPVVNAPIPSGNAQITMGNSGNVVDQMNSAQDLALVLRAGALPASVKIVEERQIGPTEGAQNIHAGVVSTLIAAGLVIVLMLVIYGMSGIVANIAMLMNIVLILAFMALFGATLTLPGIAGIVLTMAIAVDGNVIINERIREELRSGLSQKEAFYKGYHTSFKTLLDAHITSAVAGLVLVTYGNPAVKGFAVTLLCGIVCTLFTSYYVTEVIGQWLVEKTNIKRFG